MISRDSQKKLTVGSRHFADGDWIGNGDRITAAWSNLADMSAPVQFLQSNFS
jgi:hypothetical protein